MESPIPALDRLSVSAYPMPGLGRTRHTEQDAPETTDAGARPVDAHATLPLG